jgi:NADPH:quinone reductase-like Zn-dependent oxidoreductase
MKDSDLLIRIRAATVSTADWRLRSLEGPRGFKLLLQMMLGFSRPRYRCLGTDLAGEVVAVGSKVRKFRVGDRIVAHQGIRLGGHAQFAVLPETSAITSLPSSVSYAEGAAVCFGGSTALCFLRDKGKVTTGHHVLVVGGAGAVGSAAIQIAKAVGARVSAVVSQAKVELVTRLGADAVIDYQHQNWWEGAVKYDVILDTIGVADYAKARKVLASGGRLLAVVADLATTLKSVWINATQTEKFFVGSISESAQILKELLDYVQNGKFRPIISQKFRLEDIVHAHEVVDSGHKVGNVVVEMP